MVKNKMDQSTPKQPPVSCWKCQHFNTSWDKNFPYLCRALNFKSRALPCIEVRQSDGRECLAFTPKP
jgi:hypothetical protein